jgi:hypothetical protein
MAKNYMADVARMLGVELGQEFKIKDDHYIYKLIEDGLVQESDGNQWLTTAILLKLLRGNVEIVKVPWQPKDGEHYYFPAADFQYSCPAAWHNSPIDFALKEAGMIFKTKEECEAALPALRKKYLGGDDNV